MTPEEDLDSSGANMPQDITDPATGGSRLLSERCATCILAAGDRMHLGPERLRAVIAERWRRARSWSATTPSPTGTTRTTDLRSAAASTTPTQTVPRR